MAEHKLQCKNCFSALEIPNGYCPVCGWDNKKEQIPEGLPYGTVLNAHYQTGRAKSMNGEGITYAGFDTTTKKMVDIREFYPVSVAARQPDGCILALQGKENEFEEYLEKFVEMSKNVSRIREVTVVVGVLDIFEENYTAYAIYEYVPSVTLRRYIENKGVMTWNEANNLFMPVLTALGLMNSLGLHHLGLSPETVRFTTEGNLLITSFSIEEARRSGTPIIEELHAGSAAIEQYEPDAVCGEITDVYSFAAVLVYAVSGVLPTEAPKRLKDNRLLIPTDYLRNLPPYVVAGIANALQVKQENRTISFERLRSDLKAAPTVRSEMNQPSAIRRIPMVHQDSPHNRGLPPFVWLIVTCAVTLVALFVVASMWLGDSGMSFEDILDVFQNESSVSENVAVPNMLNTSLAEWEEKIKNGEYDFEIKVSKREFTDIVEEGYIISQDPNFGSQLPENKVISVVVSNGSATRTLPEIKGLSFVDLSALLEANGFVVQREEEPHADIVLGNVIRYKDHNEGDTLQYGTVITLVVSTGPEE